MADPGKLPCCRAMVLAAVAIGLRLNDSID
jgi:hypothetical protein